MKARRFKPSTLYPGLLIPVIALACAAHLHAQTQAEACDDTTQDCVYNQAGTHAFVVPEGISQITVFAWGAGGRGGTTTLPGNAGGGGGGAICIATIPVTENETLTVRVGAGGSGVAINGQSSWVQNQDLLPVRVEAAGGSGVLNDILLGAPGGTGCLTLVGSGFAGGKGGNGNIETEAARRGGGGGSSAGFSSAGANAGVAPNPGIAPSGGGGGGVGGSGANQPGEDGLQPGGGGGGATQQGFATRTGGSGAPGLILIDFTPPPDDPHLTFEVHPNNTVIDAIITPPVVVALRDGNGDIITTSSDPVTIAIQNNPGGGTLSGTLTVNAVDGIAVFIDLRINAIGNGYTLVATAAGHIGIISFPFNIRPFDGRFNAFETGTLLGAIVGDLQTKVAAEPFLFDIIAIDENGLLDTGFNRDMTVELVDPTTGAGCTEHDRIQYVLGGPELNDGVNPGWSNGRATISATEPESWQRVAVRMRLTFPVGQRITDCGLDEFAIRPDRLVVTVSHDDPETPGTAENLDNTATSGGTVHKAGRPFRIAAVALNAVNAVTSNFTGAATPFVVACQQPDGACADGLLATGTWSGNGTIVTTSATYTEAGVIELVLRNCAYAAVDLGDSTLAQRCVLSDPLLVGRFVPDHFTVNAGALVNRPEVNDCTSDFTYIGERLDAEFELTARNAGADVTQNYRAALAHLTAPGQLGLGSMNGGAEPEDLSADLQVIDADLPWNNGQVFAVAGIRHLRTQPEGPYNQFTVGIDPVDSDGVTVNTHNLDISGDETDDHVLVGDTILRFGRLSIDSRVGSELAPIILPWRAEFFEEDIWRLSNTDNCTSIDPADITIADSGIGNTFNATGSDLQLDTGAGQFFFDAPNASGFQEILPDLDEPWPFLRDCIPAENENICDQGDPLPPYTDNPSARATFGVYAGNPRRIMIREIAPQ